MSITRNRNLLIIIAVLLLTNAAVLAYFIGQKKNTKGASSNVDRDRSGVAEMLQKEVGFNEEQTAKYKEMKEKQQEKIHPVYDDMRKAKDSLFRLLSYPGTSDSVVNKMADVIAQKQKALDVETFNHFKRVRTLCTTDQLPEYDSMVLRMFRKMGKPFRHSESEKK
jgi:capsular polysaccharide biosynthesis protein